jgi:uridine phosphorylase
VPVHLRPSAPTAADAILCGDPGRALAIAQRLLVKPRMSNHHHGLWGYHGHTPAGLELTVQATGIGGPSAVVVLSELAELGLRRAVRVGTCVAAGTAPAAGAGLVVGAAVAEDGASAALGSSPGSVIEPDAVLLGRLGAVAGLTPATVVSRDVIPSASASDPGAAGGVRVLDLQTAATFTFCRGRGIAAAAVLAVASSAGRRLEDEPLEGALLSLADMAASALTPKRV